MREARIIFPTAALARERKRFEHDLVQAFGGFTLTDGYGMWAGDDGNTAGETVTIYDIAMKAESGGCLRALAVQYGHLLDQEAVYVRFASGAVEIIPLKVERAPAASPGPAVGYPGLNEAEKAFFDRVKDPQGVVRDKTDDYESRIDRVRRARKGDVLEPPTLNALRQQPGGNVGTGERQAMPLGTKRLPKVGEVWATESGGKAAVASRASIMDGGFHVSLLDAGNYAGVSACYAYTVNLDGKHLRGGDAHPLDLVRFLSAF